MRLLLLSHNLSGNALGRAYSLWLTARELGAEVHVAGPSRTGRVWPVLAGTEFAARCRASDPARGGDDIADLVEAADVLVAVKPLPASFGLARRLAARHRLPLVVDVDDPDLEAKDIAYSTRRRDRIVGLRTVLRTKQRVEHRRVRQQIAELPTLVSNPVLQRRYGGEILPHVREPAPDPGHHDREEVTIAFVGSPRRHKGLALLRDAVQGLDGFTLVVTGEAPDDAAPGERWVGTVDLAEGLALVAAADVVALPLIPHSYGAAQLPVKLVDAMMLGRAVVASDLEAIRWAADGSALLVPPGDGDALRDALLRLRDPALRAGLGGAARANALARFTPQATAGVLRAVLDAAAG